MPHPTDWPRFAESLLEGRRHPFTDYVPERVERPPCNVEVRPGDGTRYASDYRSMFLLTATAPMPADTPIRRIRKAARKHFNAAYSAPATTPLGWSSFAHAPVFYLFDNFMIPGGVAAYILWAYRDRQPIWRAVDPGRSDPKGPASVHAAEEAGDGPQPALAYVMPCQPNAYTRWRTLRD